MKTSNVFCFVLKLYKLTQLRHWPDGDEEEMVLFSEFSLSGRVVGRH